MNILGFFVSLTRPTSQQEANVKDAAARHGFNFKCPGSSIDAPPLPAAAKEDGWWAVDHERIKIAYVKDGKWKAPEPAAAQDRSGGRSGWFRKVKGRHGQRFAFASATLQGHLLAGEERFSVEWDQTDDSVWYEIYTYSRPQHILPMAGYPVLRMLQWRFRQDSMRAVARAAAQETVHASASSGGKRPEQLEP